MGASAAMTARKLFPAIIAAALLAVGIKPSFATQCKDKALLESFLRHEHGLKLHSWGINGDGNMVELWLAPSGLFAVVTTTPSACSTVEIPADLKGRLWAAPSPNKAIPQGKALDRGMGL